MSPPFGRIGDLPVFPTLYFPSQCVSGWLVEPNHSVIGQHLSTIIKAERSMGSRPVVRCGLRPSQRLLGNDLPLSAHWGGYGSIGVVAESRNFLGEASPCCHSNSLRLVVTCLPYPRQPKTW